jgi:cell division initiation protein
MKISSIDIQRQKFQVRIKGYDQEEVRNFLISVSEQIEELSRENDLSKQEIDRLQDVLSDYEERDRILKNTLVTAQQNSEAMISNTKKEAELIIKEAEFKAGKLMEHAQSQVLKIEKDMLDMKLQRKALQDKIQTSIHIMQKILEYQKEEEKTAEKVTFYGRTQEGGQK